MRRIALTLIALGMAAAGLGVGLRLAASRGQSVSAERWETERVRPQYQRTVDSVTRLSFPSQGDVYFVTDGASPKALLLGPVRPAWSAAPGQRGNCIILAHRDTHFRVLRYVRKNDRVVLERGGHKFEYRVVSMAVAAADDVGYYRPTTAPVLTLVTCYPFSYLGRAPKRYVVRAELLASAG